MPFIGFVIICLIIFQAYSANSNIYQVPVIRQPNSILVQAHATIEMNFPQFNFQKIYSRSIQQEGSKADSYEGCQQKSPYLYVKNKKAYYIQVSEGNSIPKVLTSVDQIKKKNINLLDAIAVNDKLYVKLLNGEYKIFTYNKDLENYGSEVTIKAANITKSDSGNFVNISQSVYFVNEKSIIKIDEQKQVLTDMPISEIPQQFKKAIVIRENIIAVQFAQHISFYQLSNLTAIKLNISISKQQIWSGRELFIVLEDIVYDDIRQTIFLIDKYQGLFAFKFSQNGKGEYQLQKSQGILKLSQCSLLYLTRDRKDLIIQCEDVIRINIQEWPHFTMKSLTMPSISFQQILEDGDVLGLVGQNLLEVVYLHRKTNFQAIPSLKKLILANGKFISIGTNVIVTGNYQILKPKVFCTVSQNQIGTHVLKVQTTAECNQEYFKQYNSSFVPAIGNEKCIYTDYVTIVVWEATEPPINLLVAAVIILMIVIGVTLVIICVKQCQLRSKRNELASYQSVDKHIELVEQVGHQKKKQSSHDV